MNLTDFEKISSQLADVATKKADIGDFLGSDAGRYLIGGGLGATAGAVLGAAQPDRAKKKRNMMYYGALGGLGGLGLAHVLNRSNAAQAPKPPSAPPPNATVQKVDDLPPADDTAKRLGQTEDRVVEVRNSAGQIELVHRPGVMKEKDVEPYMQSDLWKKGPRRPESANNLAAAAGVSDFDNWVQTGNLPFHKYITGRESTYTDRFRDRLRQHYKQTGQVAQTMEDLQRAGLSPAVANASFPDHNLRDPNTVKTINALRGYRGATDRVTELGVQGAYQDMQRRQQEAVAARARRAANVPWMLSR